MYLDAIGKEPIIPSSIEECIDALNIPFLTKALHTHILQYHPSKDSFTQEYKYLLGKWIFDAWKIRENLSLYKESIELGLWCCNDLCDFIIECFYYKSHSLDYYEYKLVAKYNQDWQNRATEIEIEKLQSTII